MTYKTSPDKESIIITSLVTIFFAVIIGGQYSIIKDAGNAVPMFTTIACLLIYFLAFIFRPISYKVTKDELIIKRLLLSIHIRKEDIQSVELLDKSKIRWSIRTFGVGGLFGYYGNFANFSLGKMIWYATRRNRLVLIKTVNNKKIVLTPNEPNKFVADFKN